MHPATLFLLLTLGAALLSWIGSIYNWESVQSLLSAEGMRWLLRNVVCFPWSVPIFRHLFILALGVGLCLHSGWWSLCVRMITRKGGFSRKERRAWAFSIAVGLLWLAVCAWLAYGPSAVVRSITGELSGSPFVSGLSFLCSLGVGMMAMAYGFSADTYRSDCDVVRGLSYCFSRFPNLWVTLFFVVLFISILHYTGLDVWMKVDGVIMFIYTY